MADALVNGKIIRIRIGDIQVGVRRREIGFKKARVEVVKSAQEQEEIVRGNILNYLKPAEVK